MSLISEVAEVSLGSGMKGFKKATCLVKKKDGYIQFWLVGTNPLVLSKTRRG